VGVHTCAMHGNHTVELFLSPWQSKNPSLNDEGCSCGAMLQVQMADENVGSLGEIRRSSTSKRRNNCALWVFCEVAHLRPHATLHKQGYQG
jgi:hypothetical protein